MRSLILSILFLAAGCGGGASSSSGSNGAGGGNGGGSGGGSCAATCSFSDQSNCQSMACDCANGGTTNYVGCNNGCCATSCPPPSEVGNC